MYELMIIGGGPSGIAATVYAARKRLKTVLISANIGGQINNTWGIENYLGYQFIEGPELISKFESQISQFPIDQRIGEKVSRVVKAQDGFEAVTESGRYQAKAVIIATGKSPRKLNVPGETELTGRGVTYCAICDGPVFAGRKVAVIGGGNSALEATLDMVKIAEHVSLVSLTDLTGDPVLIERLADAKNLTVYKQHQTLAIKGKDLVEGITVKDMKSGNEKALDVAGVFIEIGLVPNSALVKDLVKLNEHGEIIVSCACETSVPGVYAAGDVTNIPEKQIIIAAGEGAKAALQAHRYLRRLTA
jgi:alkyl hydroperoxide reductase subunit F